MYYSSKRDAIFKRFLILYMKNKSTSYSVNNILSTSLPLQRPTRSTFMFSSCSADNIIKGNFGPVTDGLNTQHTTPTLSTATLNDARPSMGCLLVQQADIQCRQLIESVYQNEFLCKPQHFLSQLFINTTKFEQCCNLKCPFWMLLWKQYTVQGTFCLKCEKTLNQSVDQRPPSILNLTVNILFHLFKMKRIGPVVKTSEIYNAHIYIHMSSI